MLDSITHAINEFTAANVAVIALIPSISGVAAQIAVYMPPPKDLCSYYAKVYIWVNWAGRNVGHAENKR